MSKNQFSTTINDLTWFTSTMRSLIQEKQLSKTQIETILIGTILEYISEGITFSMFLDIINALEVNNKINATPQLKETIDELIISSEYYLLISTNKEILFNSLTKILTKLTRKG